MEKNWLSAKKATLFFYSGRVRDGIQTQLSWVTDALSTKIEPFEQKNNNLFPQLLKMS